MKSPDNVSQLVVIVGTVKEIEGAHIEDNGSDTTEDSDEKKD